ncbi:MAG: hypothetical protein NZ473_03700, partial [Candidatus Kapabacteria bacterium]|nr:hypothetical protein [Candidatus Kapabacteria bacterium]
MNCTALQWLRSIGLILAGLTISGLRLPAQETSVLADVLCFAAEDPDSNARLDVWTIVPYAALNFRPTDTTGFRASYTLSITIRDSLGNNARQHRAVRSLTAQTYAIAQGATAAF